MDLTGIDENIGEMFCVVACGLYIFATFASFTIEAGVFFLLAYIFYYLDMVGLIMKLTDEQIAALAPDWATHYHVNENNLCFFNQNNAVLVNKSGNYISDIYENEIGIEASDIPVPEEKPFDISEYEFSDTAKDCGVEFNVPAWVYPDIEINVKDITGGDNTAVLMKEHAIAIAKHFKLTAEDLK